MKTLFQSVRLPIVVATVAASGCLLSMVLFLTLRDWERREQAEHLASLVQENVTTLRVSLLRSMEVLSSLASLHAADEGISRKQFTAFVQGALRRQPELLALSWNPLVPDVRRSAVEVEGWEEGDGSFCFRELDGAGRLVAAGKRPEYVPVRFIEPRERNAGVLGYDLYSDPRRRASVERARDGGSVVATAPIRLAQDEAGAGQEGFLVVFPVYTRAMPQTLDERRQSIAGFAVAVFRLSDLVRESFRSLRERGVEVWVQDDETREVTPGAGASGIELDFAGRRLTVHYAASAGFRASPGRHQSWLVLVGGILLTGVGAAYLVGNGRRAGQVAAANLALREEVRIRQRAEAEAAAASTAKSDFLASMSHEMRTPLNAILGYVQLLQRDGELSPEHRDSLAAIGLSGRHLLGLINEILDLAKIEAGRMEQHAVDFDLEGLVRGLAATFHPLCIQKRISFHVNVEGPAPGWGGIRVRGDEGKLRQILINLVGNAVKFTGAGGVTLSVRPEEAGRWAFEVSDTGQGIPPEEQTEIFKPFHQGPGSRHLGGTGLGLAIAQRQVRLLGGDLQVESERGRGSRFFFSLVLEPGTVEAPTPVGQPVRLAAGATVRALVVDDRRENREVIGRMLALAGCAVAYARDAAEAEAQVREFRPDVVLLDLLLPDVSGVELARRWLSEPALGRIKIIAHSASPLPSLRSEARAAGCVDFLAKPVRCEQIYECLITHLGVTFESAVPPRELESPAGLPEGMRVRLPEEFQSRLAFAAELHSTTALKDCLGQLRQHGPEAALLADEIRHLMRSYDMDGIQQLLARTLENSRAEAGHDAHAHAAATR